MTTFAIPSARLRRQFRRQFARQFLGYLRAAALIATPLATLAAAGALDSLTPGPVELQSAGPLAFGPDGILFAADPMGGRIFALDTGDRTPAAGPVHFNLPGINKRIATQLGAPPDQITIVDLAANPISGNAYLSVARGRGPAAVPSILRVTPQGEIARLELHEIPHDSIGLPEAAGHDRDRESSITAMVYSDGALMAAGLSDREFPSTLWSIPFPFEPPSEDPTAGADSAADRDEDGAVKLAPEGTSIEFYHPAHARFESTPPMLAFTPLPIGGEDYLLAAYADTPLVKIPLGRLEPGGRLTGATIAQFGTGSRPLDLIAYGRDGKDYLLLASSSRGVIRIEASELDTYEALKEPASVAGVPFRTLGEWTGVQQLVKTGEGAALILAGTAGSLDLRTVPLP